MAVDTATATERWDYKGATYYFCCDGCRSAFQADPEKYLANPPAVMPFAPAAVHAAPKGGQYTCPMHPEVAQDGPGSCPKCGMPLVPVAGAEEDDSELRDMTRRFWVSLALSVAVVGLAMVLPQLGGHVYTPAAQRWSGLAQLALATPVVLWGGWPFFHKFRLSLANRSPNMYTLIGLGVALAYLFSLAGVLAPGLFPQEFREHGGAVGVYFEAAAVIVTLILLGEVLQLRAMGQTSRAIRELLALAPNTALRIAPDGR
jgi:Cu+-exporting ATPase